MKKLILGMMLLTVSFSSFADSSALCETFKKQIVEREADVVKTEKIISETQEELAVTSNDLNDLEKKYSRRKKIWIPVATVAGIAAVATGAWTLFSKPASSGTIVGDILLGGLDIIGKLFGITVAGGLGAGAYMATRPISVTKKQLESTQEAMSMLSEGLEEYEDGLDKLEDQVNELKLSYARHCE